MGWYKDPVLEGDEVLANKKCTCCLMTLILGMIGTGVMLKMYYANYLWPKYLMAARMLGKILLPKRTLPDLAETQPRCPS